MARYAVVIGDEATALELSGGSCGSALALFATREEAEQFVPDFDYSSGVVIVEVDDTTLVAIAENS